MAKYRKKPVVVDAFRWTGGPDQEEDPEWIVEAIDRGDVFFAADPLSPFGAQLKIRTLEGDLCAQSGDWIVRGVKGEIYPVKPDVFAMTYESA